MHRLMSARFLRGGVWHLGFLLSLEYRTVLFLLAGIAMDSNSVTRRSGRGEGDMHACRGTNRTRRGGKTKIDHE